MIRPADFDPNIPLRWSLPMLAGAVALLLWRAGVFNV